MLACIYLCKVLAKNPLFEAISPLVPTGSSETKTF
jgi:hypothetical protein